MITKLKFNESHKFKELLKVDLNDEKVKVELQLKSYGITNYNINNDNTIDVNEDVDLRNKRLIKIPFKFGIIKGSFDCSDNKLTSLQGAPTTVNGYFDCSDNNLTSLQGAPITVRYFDCSDNNLTSLQGAPTTVWGDFDCSDNKLTSLQGAPTTVKDFYCYDNNLTSLQGAPTTVEGSFYCSSNNLTSLQDAPITVNGYFDCSDNSKLLETYGSKEGIINYIRANCKVGINIMFKE